MINGQNVNQIEYVKIEELTLLENNPRQITKEQFAKLLKSLTDDPEFFEHRPCLINRVNGVMTVYAGNQRVRAAKELGWVEVPCKIDDALNEELIASRVIKDNIGYGTWSYDELFTYDTDLLLDCGFTESMLDGAFDEIKEIEGEIPEKKGKKKKSCPSCGHEW